ncbi:MAG: hypothetical protein AVDCRST_MAG77-60 [uncultured Chloroflexi bacterium]|uniref:Polymerase nucleotidyl transferase domain-containing protein n=1 Tax=uncultured Chloroflexota bacterium TaxID=166587 RepID=A0A6J4H2E0_9CHLR|nr:MAG: hypothetical protein AVDCRST_MAG77-60 [uncultured Chloroflexota bacterium]
MTRLVGEAKAVARRWVLEEGSKAPGFRAAYFAGSAIGLADEAPVHATSDLDINLVFDGDAAPPKKGKFLQEGVLLEANSFSSEQLGTAEQVLGNYHLAGGLRRPEIILDPSGWLTQLQAAVGPEFPKRHWVRRRCEHAADNSRSTARALNDAMPLHDQATVCAFAAGVTTHVLLVAGLENPTVRRRYAAARDLLAAYGRLDFHEQLLALLGCAEMPRERVEQHLAAVTAAFDAAKSVFKTPYRFGSDISDAARPISIDGSRELIERGDHREAVFWLMATYSRCRTILSVDAPPAVQEQLEPGFRALIEDLGLGSFADRQRKADQVLAFLPHVWEVAEEIMAANSGIEE